MFIQRGINLYKQDVRDRIKIVEWMVIEGVCEFRREAVKDVQMNCYAKSAVVGVIGQHQAWISTTSLQVMFRNQVQVEINALSSSMLEIGEDGLGAAR